MNKSKTKYLLNLISLISTIFFFIIIVSIILKHSFVKSMDINLLHWFNATFGEPQMNYSNGMFNDFMTASATYGDISTFIIITIVISLVALFRRQFIFSLWTLSTVAIGGILGIILKYVFHRARPYDHLLSDSGYSFPSGHSLTSTLVILMILLILIPHLKRKSLKILFTSLLIFFWIGILFSRLYFHAHFLSDVLGGVTFSISWLTLSYTLYKLCTSKLNAKHI
ncbi:phosphatase PAP2 family protein [Staphylococcus aureus]|nr:phosphatase PAP2 family protein [Staphylococcus aureus]